MQMLIVSARMKVNVILKEAVFKCEFLYGKSVQFRDLDKDASL